MINYIARWVAKLFAFKPRTRKEEPNMTLSQMFAVLKQFEGNEYTPYVPPIGKSGVTIGIGVDLGHMNFGRILESNTLEERIAPYYGKFREEAEEALRNRPLSLTKAEVDYISTLAIETHLNELKLWYNNASLAPFGSLTDNQKCVMLSVKYQYGNIRKRTPKFWGFCIKRDWRGAYNELMNFGDDYPTRRRREAAMLAKDLK